MHVTVANVAKVIIAAIPELRAEVEENEDLHHVTFGDLYRWTEHASLEGTLSNVRRSVQLVDSIFRDCDSYISNAVTVSFLECISLNEVTGRQIFDELTPALQIQWRELDEYLRELAARSDVIAKKEIPKK